LYDTFSTFGMMATTAKVLNFLFSPNSRDPHINPPQIARDPQSGESKGYGFVSFTDFEASDAAIESMNNQFLMNKPVTVQYAFKKEGKGERHGTPAERLLAAQARKNNALPPRGARPGGPVPYQGQFAGVFAQPPPPPPTGPFGMGGMPQQPPMMPPGPPPQGFGQQPGFPPPPAGFGAPPGMGIPGMGPPMGMSMMPPPPPGFGMQSN
jgi:splicing factor 3B subunit 4